MNSNNVKQILTGFNEILSGRVSKNEDLFKIIRPFLSVILLCCILLFFLIVPFPDKIFAAPAAICTRPRR